MNTVQSHPIESTIPFRITNYSDEKYSSFKQKNTFMFRLCVIMGTLELSQPNTTRYLKIKVDWQLAEEGRISVK